MPCHGYKKHFFLFDLPLLFEVHGLSDKRGETHTLISSTNFVALHQTLCEKRDVNRSYLWFSKYLAGLEKNLGIRWSFFFYLVFLLRTFMNHWTARKVGGHFFNSHYHFYPSHRHFDISRAITAESSPLHIAGSRP